MSSGLHVRRGSGDQAFLPPSVSADRASPGSPCSGEPFPLDVLEPPGGERLQYEVDRCLSDLERIRASKEEASDHLTKAVREQADVMLASLSVSMEATHRRNSQRVESRCEEIVRALRRVEVLCADGEEAEELARRRGAVEQQVEEAVRELNEKREADEQMLEDMAADVREQVQSALRLVQRGLEADAERRVEAVNRKIADLQKALANVRHLMKEV